MDTFAAAIGKGLVATRINKTNVLTTALWFSGFQVLFPLLGAWIGSTLSTYVGAVDHWIIFALLVLLGVNMIRETLHDDEANAQETPQFDWRHMLPLAVACSIDSLAVGVSLAFMQVNVWFAVALIGVVTAALSTSGLHLGKVLGTRWQKPAQIAGGIVLILVGTKTLLEHLGLLP